MRPKWRDRGRWGSCTATYDTLWQTSTGFVHRSMQCPHINGEIVQAVSGNVIESEVVDTYGKRACSICWPSAPGRRTRVAGIEQYRTDYTNHSRSNSVSNQ